MSSTYKKFSFEWVDHKTWEEKPRSVSTAQCINDKKWRNVCLLIFHTNFFFFEEVHASRGGGGALGPQRHRVGSARGWGAHRSRREAELPPLGVEVRSPCPKSRWGGRSAPLRRRPVVSRPGSWGRRPALTSRWGPRRPGPTQGADALAPHRGPRGLRGGSAPDGARVARRGPMPPFTAGVRGRCDPYPQGFRATGAREPAS